MGFASIRNAGQVLFLVALCQVVWAVAGPGLTALWPAALALLAGAALTRGMRWAGYLVFVGAVVAAGMTLGAMGQGWMVWLRGIQIALLVLAAASLFIALWRDRVAAEAV